MSFGKLKLKTPLNQSSAIRTKKQKQQKQQVQKIFDQKLKTKDKITTYQPVNGTGLIVTSGTTIIGQDTKFKNQIENGDFILIENTLLKTVEEREVMVVLGERSILLKQPFIEQTPNYTQFKIKKKSRIQKGEDIASEYAKKLEQIKKTKQISKNTIDLRIKKGMWKYETEKVEVSRQASKEELLDIRAKKIKDKFCW